MISMAAVVLPAGPDATNELFNSIQNVIMRALLAVQPVMINDKHSFEVGSPAAAALLLSGTFCCAAASRTIGRYSASKCILVDRET
jgi:hypothetical protein